MMAKWMKRKSKITAKRGLCDAVSLSLSLVFGIHSVWEMHLNNVLQPGGVGRERYPFNLFNLTGQRATCILNWIEIARLMELLSSFSIMQMSRGVHSTTKVVSILFMNLFVYAPNLILFHFFSALRFQSPIL